ncbi:ABC transporter substrate-binding protein [Streptomyces sp. NPDC059740]|uniref:ABC transporter substrate-binding protein n=1 Tax=Streptomyces sp. NPDC059740 TaxID=3346926 RepID=UPI0036617464
MAAAALPAAGLLAGCSGTGRQRGARGAVTLRFQSLAWQQESVEANKRLVQEWNARHRTVRVEYVQGSWDTVHDQLLTAFEGGEAPDVIHDASDDLADFAYGGYLADLTDLRSDRLRADIPEASWRTGTFAGRVHGVPFLQEPRVLLANRALLHAAGVDEPTPAHPWSWPEFEAATRRLTGHGRHGMAWPLKEPVSLTLNLALSTGGRVFYAGEGGDWQVRFDSADSQVARVVHDQITVDRTASRTALGMSGSDTLPAFFAGRYAMVPLGFSYRQQIVQQAPKDFDWTVLPSPAGSGPGQGVSPQTLSVAETCRHKEAAMEFVDFLLSPPSMVRLALGDWMLPTGTTALRDPRLHTSRYHWATGTALAPTLHAAPAQAVRGYAEWKDKVATPGLQEYYSGAVGLGELRRRLVEDGNRVLARYQR